jgi:hypothetical protein
MHVVLKLITIHVLQCYMYVLPSVDRYMKYLYPYECEKRQLSTPEELQVAIEGNRREGRRSSYGTYSEMVQRSPLPSLPPTHPSQMSPLSLVTSGRPAMNGNSNHHHHHPSHPQPHGQPLGAGMQHATHCSELVKCHSGIFSGSILCSLPHFFTFFFAYSFHFLSLGSGGCSVMYEKLYLKLET